MSAEINKHDRPSQEPPLLWGLDLGERWGRELGSIDSRLSRVEADIQKLDAKFQNLDAKIDMVDGRVDKCLLAINRMDERLSSIRTMIFGLGAAVLAGIILQYFK